MSDSTPSDRLLALLPGAALDVLDVEERREFEALRAADPERAAGLASEWRSAAAAIADSLGSEIEPVRPSDLVRARLLREIGASAPGIGAPVRAASVRPEAVPRIQPEAAAAGRRWPLRLAAAAALLLALWSGVSQWRLRGEVERLAEERERLDASVRATQAELVQARQQLESAVWAQRVVASPDVRPIVLAGLGPLPQARAHTFVDPLDRRAVFYAYNLPPAAAGRVYQLWFIAAGVPVPAGTFDADARGRATLNVENVAAVDSIQAWAVTVEPAGGVPQPTGPMVLKG